VKVEDGAWRAAPMALLAVIVALLERSGGAPALDLEGLSEFVTTPILSTRDVVIGEQRAAGELRFFDR
jgi:L-asparaginase II